MFGNLRTYLRRVAVNRLPSGEDDIERDVSQGGSQRVRCCPRVGSAEFPIAKQDGTVCAHGIRFAKNRFGLRRPHRKDRNMRPELVFQEQCLFQSALVVRIHDARHPVADKRSFHRIEFDFRRIRNLFDTNNDIHNVLFFLF